MRAADFLGAQRRSDCWTFDIGTELHGAFGGAFGGAVAAACVVAARAEAPGRVPASLDCRFLRGLPAGTATVATAVLHQGRTLTTVLATVMTEDGRLATQALVGLVAAGALRPVERSAGEPPHGQGRGWGAGLAPIVDTLRPELLGLGSSAVATTITVPFDVEDASAEACCFAADLCVGPPVAAAVSGERVSHPNPDLSVRFAGEVTTQQLVAVGRTPRTSGGVALVEIEVWSGDAVVAVGVSSSLLL